MEIGLFLSDKETAIRILNAAKENGKIEVDKPHYVTDDDIMSLDHVLNLLEDETITWCKNCSTPIVYQERAIPNSFAWYHTGNKGTVCHPKTTIAEPEDPSIGVSVRQYHCGKDGCPGHVKPEEACMFNKTGKRE